MISLCDRADADIFLSFGTVFGFSVRTVFTVLFIVLIFLRCSESNVLKKGLITLVYALTKDNPSFPYWSLCNLTIIVFLQLSLCNF